MRVTDEQRRLYQAEIAMRDALLLHDFMKARGLEPMIEAVVMSKSQTTNEVFDCTGENFERLGLTTPLVVQIESLIDHSR